MKTVIKFSFLLILIGCKTIVDNAYTTRVIIKNNLKSNVVFKVYYPTEAREIIIESLSKFAVTDAKNDSPTPPFLNADSIRLTLDTKYKIDRNCVLNTKPSCRADTISFFNISKYISFQPSEYATIYTYSIDRKDSAEVR